MPEVTKVFTIDITPERFIDACSDIELKELDMLLSSPRFQQRLKATEIGFKSNTSQSKASQTDSKKEQE